MKKIFPLSMSLILAAALQFNITNTNFISLAANPLSSLTAMSSSAAPSSENTKKSTESTEQPKSSEANESAESNSPAAETALEITAPSAILIEASTGTTIYEKSPDEQRPPASITKIMTLILIFDALASGKISLEDNVTVSEYAASMGGSQVFLEPNETQTVDTMIKCIAVASANDACASFN